VEVAVQADFSCVLTRDRLFGESAARALKRFPQFSVVLVAIPPTTGTGVPGAIPGSMEPYPDSTGCWGIATLAIRLIASGLRSLLVPERHRGVDARGAGGWRPARHECRSRESAARWRTAKLHRARWKPASIRTAPSSPGWPHPHGSAATPPRRSHLWRGLPARLPRPGKQPGAHGTSTRFVSLSVAIG
jgi:hypothetical protein